jgi:pimeloyl-ACP methyl ester carboxylesterase
MWKDPSPHVSGFVEANGVRLNYLDWGGSGQPLILVPGFSDNPHIFDDLAPQLSGRFRVVSYARRGHGLTEAKPPYDTPALTRDLLALMDQLKIERAHLAGKSMGGNEVTAFAGLHPARTGRIIYLDGGYDFSEPGFADCINTFPMDPSPPESVFAAWPAYLEWHYQNMFPGVSEPARTEAYLRELAMELPDGTLKMRMDPEAGGALWKSLMRDPRDYSKVRAKALSVYAATFEETEHGDPERRAKFSAWEAAHFAPFRRSSVDRIEQELSGVEILRLPGTHSDFVFTSRDQLAGSIDRFLSI